MQKAWIRIPLKILLVYFIACTPDMWKLLMLKPPLSIASIVFVLASSFAAPWAYFLRMGRGEMEYLPAFVPFAVILAVGLYIVWFTESRKTGRDGPAR